MKEQKLCNVGFILTEALVGVTLFVIVMAGVLRAISFINDCVSNTSRYHQGLSRIVESHDEVIQEVMAKKLPYMHHAVTWHKSSISIGTYTVFLYRVQKIGAP